jgi:hypothetical protein
MSIHISQGGHWRRSYILLIHSSLFILLQFQRSFLFKHKCKRSFNFKTNLAHRKILVKTRHLRRLLFCEYFKFFNISFVKRNACNVSQRSQETQHKLLHIEYHLIYFTYLLNSTVRSNLQYSIQYIYIQFLFYHMTTVKQQKFVFPCKFFFFFSGCRQDWYSVS